MPISSPWSDLQIPACNVLSYLFPQGEPPSTQPLWIDASNPNRHSLSMAQTLQLVKRVAVGLDNLGISTGQSVLVCSPNNIYIPVLYLACVGSKRVFSGASPAFTEEELAYQISNLDAAAIFVHRDYLHTMLLAAERSGVPRERVFIFGEDTQPPQGTVTDWWDILASEEASDSWQWDELSGDGAQRTVATINFSSGTTGLPKGVCISHSNIIANVVQTAFVRFGTPPPHSTQRPGQEEVWLAFLPLYHAYSQLWTILIAAKLQCRVYIMAQFNFEKFLQHVQDYQVTGIQCVPPVLTMLSKRPETTRLYNLQSLKHAVCGAAPLKAALHNDIRQRLGIAITQGWGMTETTCVATSMLGKTEDMSGSVGYLLPNTQAMLVDDNGDEETRPDTPGEILVRGPQVFLEYWKNRDATHESKADAGWFRMGDVAVCRGGKWWIVDRKKELIKVKGFQVAPAEIEAVLVGHDAVADAAVVGLPTYSGEELPRAYVVPQRSEIRLRVDEGALQVYMKGKVARHKQLTGGICFVDSIPRLASGKIKRKEVREWARRDAELVAKRARL
ncbi:hypothetical protein BDV18DRAFT_159649 [Aspergillus unguis]